MRKRWRVSNVLLSIYIDLQIRATFSKVSGDKAIIKSEGVFYTRSGYHIICNVLIHIIQIIKKCIS